MIQLIDGGDYKLIETKGHTKILTLDDKQYPWFFVKGIGEILSRSYKTHKINTVLSKGKYRLYSVEDEPDLVDLQHLELSIEGDLWQGYLLPRGLPVIKNSKHRIIPTEELITKKYKFFKFYGASLDDLSQLT